MSVNFIDALEAYVSLRCEEYRLRASANWHNGEANLAKIKELEPKIKRAKDSLVAWTVERGIA